MSFLSPLFLAGALTAAIPIVLHLLKRAPEARVRFSAVHLLKHAPVEQASRRRLRDLVLLALRVAALLLLALAFARPFFPAGAGATGATSVVALDVSMSMSAPGQFERGRQLALDALDAAPSGDLVAVVTFADRAQIAVPPTGDRASARAAIDAARPGSGATSYRAALATAGDLLRGGTGSITVVTDLQESGWDAGERALVPSAATIRVADVGVPPPNLAVTALRVSGDRVTATIRNGGADRVEARVRLRVHGQEDRGQTTRIAAETPVPVEAGEVATMDFPRPSGVWASVDVEDTTGVEADNARYAVIDESARPSVVIVTSTGDVTREAFYLEQALGAAASDGRAYAADGVAADDLASWRADRLEGRTAVVLLSTRGLDHRGRQLLTTYLQQGGGLLVAAGPDVDGDVLDEVLGGPRVGLAGGDGDTARPSGAVAPSAAATQSTASTQPVASTWAAADVRHPVIRAFGVQPGALGLVQFRRTRLMRPSECQTLARFTTGDAALVDCASGDGHALIIASDLDNRGNDFPLHATFVPILHQSMQYLSSGRARAAEYLVGNVPEGVPSV
ncbi:MAG: BatA domain-containing protein, partial [Vicinamibacterales bacterium]